MNCPYCKTEVKDSDSHAFKIVRLNILNITTIIVSCTIVRELEIKIMERNDE